MTLTPDRTQSAAAVSAAVPRPQVVQTMDERLGSLARQPLARAGRPVGLLAGTAHSVRDIWAYRQLLGLLVRRELKARYKDSTLGFLWSLLKPLALLAVYYVAIGKFLQAAKGAPDFAIFIFSGLTVWQLFSEILSTTTGSILANGGLVKKIYLPREVFPLSAIGSALFNFVIQLMVLIVATFIVGKPPAGSRWIYAGLALLLIVLLATALGFLLSAVNVYLRDVQYLVEIMLMFAMWTAPIVYQWSYVAQALGTGRRMEIYQLNPLSLAAEAFQKTFWVAGDHFVNPSRPLGTQHPSHLLLSLGIEIVVSLFLLWGCQRVFARLQDNFAQEI